MEIRLANLKWPEIAAILKGPNVVLLPTGSTEQHGPHLPVNVDSCCSTYLAEQAALRFGTDQPVRVLVAPTVHYTEVDTFRRFPGTIGISLETEVKLLEEIVRSFVTNGFANVFVVNGHSSNTIPINAALRQVNAQFPEAGLYAVNWWSLGNLRSLLKSPPSLHAEEMETSVCLVAEPELVDMSKAYAEYPTLSLSAKWATPDFYGLGKSVFYHSRKKYPEFGKAMGVMGDATAASVETGRKIVDAVVDDLAAIIEEIAQAEHG